MSDKHGVFLYISVPQLSDIIIVLSLNSPAYFSNHISTTNTYEKRTMIITAINHSLCLKKKLSYVIKINLFAVQAASNSVTL